MFVNVCTYFKCQQLAVGHNLSGSREQVVPKMQRQKYNQKCPLIKARFLQKKSQNPKTEKPGDQKYSKRLNRKKKQVKRLGNTRAYKRGMMAETWQQGGETAM